MTKSKYAGRGTRKATPRKGTKAGRPRGTRKPLTDRSVRADGKINFPMPVEVAALLQRVSAARPQDTSPEDTLAGILLEEAERLNIRMKEQRTMKLVNLTPHTVTLRDADGNDHQIESTGRAVLNQEAGELIEVPGVPVPVAQPATGHTVSGVPEPEPDTMYIVSFPVAAFLKRPDVVSPGTSPQDGAIRNEAGHIVAVTRLIRHG